MSNFGKSLATESPDISHLPRVGGGASVPTSIQDVFPLRAGV